jgi:hypothetical protein
MRSFTNLPVHDFAPSCRARVLWWDGVVVTDPAALAAICGRGEGAMDKAAVIYGPVNQVGCGLLSLLLLWPEHAGS